MWKRKSKHQKADEDAASASGPATLPASASAPPPAYGAAPDTHPSGPQDLSAALGALNLDASPPGTDPRDDPNEDTCLAHLRLLTAFHRLKSETGYRDGLWEIWDSRAQVSNASSATSSSNSKAAAAAADGGAGSLNTDVLVKLREKRWAVYVGRAADRYAAWWRSFVPDMLLESDMVEPSEERKDRYTASLARPHAKPQTLPRGIAPLIARKDCLRYGHGALWAAGMPWPVVNKAIAGATFDYDVSDACIAQWEARTSRAWRNEDDPDTKQIRCPSCPAMVSVPWTTCGQPRDYKGTKRPGIAGEGYADGHLNRTCPSCSVTVTHESLRAAKFRNDIQASVTSDHAMPGTILDLHTGLPKPLKYDSDNSNSAGCPDQLFPARLARRGLLVEVVEMLRPGSKVAPSMMAVRDNMEENFTGKFADSKNLKEAMNRHGHKKVTDFRLSLDGRRQTRKMMSRYWENSSPFATDLVGCVMRQGTFTEKMCKLNWLHFPTARGLMTGLLKKYTRFVEIIAIASTTKDKVAVPTLDVDLAWHTHQLSPQSYFVFTLAKTSAFVDHNDKVDEDKLSTAFEWTSKTYQEKYGEIYAQCKCWYCESEFLHHLHPCSRTLAIRAIMVSIQVVSASRRTPTEPSTRLLTAHALSLAVRVMALPATKMFGIGKEEKRKHQSATSTLPRILPTRLCSSASHRTHLPNPSFGAVLEAWHAAAKANNVPMPPTAESAHVSSHPAVHTNETTARRATTRPRRLEYRNRLEETHSKARKRANKTFKADAGKRMGPRGEDRASFWGKDIEIDGPWASNLAAATTSAMYPAPPGFVNMGPGSVGSCATGTCGGATGCGSELLGMCSAGCVGSGWFGGNAGCTGMGTTSGVGGSGF
ncbi:alpha-ketoglutarate-dependent sulfonate dioxygenase [Colletotrichum tofieldiae]|uniref:Alpha-ketoglutarate-dependent sulfonate dioxygenase n=1 Tax=Colletotrichum tofieldiae TaxID=708197 RepID=A0A166ZFH8_9PEZI|nr:alpha-ketoglutarate-dependent sulfonate dioxygenase [Colletotrichum tofieldiae]